MVKNYQQWIAAHQPTDPRGLCVMMTLKMVEAFPELRRVRGHYYCPMSGEQYTHWWLMAADGSIIDPTADQFLSCGAGVYEEYAGPEPTGKCLDCGALLFGPLTFCDATCAYRTAQYLAQGGRVFVNGIDVTPESATKPNAEASKFAGSQVVDAQRLSSLDVVASDRKGAE